MGYSPFPILEERWLPHLGRVRGQNEHDLHRLRGAVELVETVRENVSIDWTMRENVRAHLRVLVKRILRRHGYPPDKQEAATRTVLEQAQVWSGG